MCSEKNLVVLEARVRENRVQNLPSWKNKTLLNLSSQEKILKSKYSVGAKIQSRSWVLSAGKRAPRKMKGATPQNPDAPKYLS